MTTPPKFNIGLEHKSLEKESPFGIFSGSMLNFGGGGVHIEQKMFQSLGIPKTHPPKKSLEVSPGCSQIYTLQSPGKYMYMCTYNGINIWLPIYVVYEFTWCIWIGMSFISKIHMFFFDISYFLRV